MPQAIASETSAWTQAVRQRRSSLLQRLATAVTAALIFSPIMGWEICGVWLLGYVAIQALDLWVFAPINAGRETMPRLRNVAGGLILALNTGYFASLSVPLWLLGGAMGGVCAAILLSAGTIYSIINAPRSATVMLLTASTQFFYLAAMPVFMAVYGASAPTVIATVIAVVVYVGYCLDSWRRIARASEAEEAARRDADQKRLEAERAMAGRSAFLNAVGHDLRTPISAILAGAAELEQGASDGAARAQARLIADAGLMMKALLDDLLDHARLEAGRMQVEEKSFDLRAMAASTLRLWQAPARAKGLKLRLEGAASLPRHVRGDAMRLNQVLNNLLSNAMKFTEQGSVTLRLAAWPEDGGGHAVIMEVVDTGPGMDADQMARLFNVFDQTADGVSARHGGAGLGLSISRDLARLMGGRLTARSRPGEGACFTLALSFPDADGRPVETILDRASREAAARVLNARPHREMSVAPVFAEAPPSPEPAEVAPAAAETVAPVCAEEAEASERPLSILVVDDHDINRRAIQLILTPLGCDVAMAADGLAALDACEASAFDLIFMDVRMPELDGREATRRLRAGGGLNATTPVIAVTADTAPEDIAACTAAGMDYFVPKPITPASLLAAVQHVLAPAHEDQSSPLAVAG